ncbi:uncharacterized protein LOC110813286 [Carica papaya]|uniref:uncharacterized protein LOC110813286 n=1 Tax=Carica papaya TaxID=3649 RepID=UPI000B8CB1BE|nr:uncharacterized protein LOC110813286 [Carica papaya]
MMNVVGLCLVLTSLVVSGVLSPNPPASKKNGLVKEEHRMIVVEYDKVIEHQHDNHKPKLTKQLSAISSYGKPSVPSFPTYWDMRTGSPADLLCHALGVCTSKFESKFDRAKHGLKWARESVAEKAHEMKESTKESLGKAKKRVEDSTQSTKECAEGFVGKAKEIVAQTAHDVKESAGDSWEKAKESVEQKAHDAKESAKQFLEKEKEGATQKVHDVKESAGDYWGKAKESVEQKAHDASERTNQFLEKEKEEATQKVQDMKESAEEAWRKAEKSVEQKAHEAQESAKQFLEEEKEKASQKVHDVKESTKEFLHRAAQKAEDLKESTKKQLDVAKGRERSTETVAKAIRLDIAANATNAIIYVVKKTKDEASRLIGGVRYLGFREVSSSLNVAVNLLGFATAYGMCIWVTFISSYVLHMALPRQQLGVVQSKIYPVYFQALAASISAALLGHLLCLGKKWMSNKAEMLQGYNLLASLLMVFANAVFLEPRASKVMFERMRLEREEGIESEKSVPEPTRQTEIPPFVDPSVQTTATRSTGSTEEERVIRLRIVRLKERLKKLNSYSSLLNILTLMALTWHLVYLSQRLNMTC